MKIFYRTADGRSHKAATARMALVNWYYDEVAGDTKPSVYVADNHRSFAQQIVASVERRFGRCPRIDDRLSEEDQLLYLLKFIHQQGGITKLLIN